MIDISDVDIHFRGYPVRLIGTECAARLNLHTSYDFTPAALLDPGSDHDRAVRGTRNPACPHGEVPA